MCGSRRPKRLRFGPCRTRIFMLLSPVRGVPVFLEVRDERGTEMALRLLACVHRHVAAEEVERFLPRAECAPVARGADHSGTRQLLHGGIDRLIHIFVWNDLVAKHSTFRARTVDAPLGEDRLAR